jgi:hypothetical protein
MLFLLCGFASAVAADVAAKSVSVSPPPAGSAESKVKIGDTREKIVSLLGEVEIIESAGGMRSRFVFERCSIVFEAGKVAQLPVMRSESELSEELANKTKAAQEREAAAKPDSPQNLARSKAKVSALLSHFEPVVSRPDFPVIYVHKGFPTDKYGLMPSVLIDDRGAVALATSYYGGAWIFHDSVGVRIGDKNYASSILDRGKPQRRVAQAGFIEERCVFESESDQQLVREISLAKGRRVFVSLTRQGGSVLSALTEQQFASFPPILELSSGDMTAFRESVELSDAFAVISKARMSKK